MENNIDEFDEPMVSLFENIFAKEATKKIPLTEFLLTEQFKEPVEHYRRSNDEKEKIKKSLPCVTPSGAFTDRINTLISTHTKLICVDLDSKDNPEFDLKKSKHIIGRSCPSLYYAGLSIGGEGLFLLFRISNPELHRQHFDALAFYLNEKFGLIVDKAVKSLNSLRVASYDPNPYYNPQPVPFQRIIETEKKTGEMLRTVAEKAKITQDVDRAIKIILKNEIDITDGYANWYKIGNALVSEFGEDGRDRFHMISSYHKDYCWNDCDIQYSKCLKSRKSAGVTIATFFHYCKEHGVDWVKAKKAHD
jgi:hypothetical protein